MILAGWLQNLILFYEKESVVGVIRLSFLVGVCVSVWSISAWAEEGPISGCPEFPRLASAVNVELYSQDSLAPFYQKVKEFRAAKAKAAEMDDNKAAAYLAPFKKAMAIAQKQAAVCLAPSMRWWFFTGSKTLGPAHAKYHAFDQNAGLQERVGMYINWLNNQSVYSAEKLCGEGRSASQEIMCNELIIPWWGVYSNLSQDGKRQQATRLSSRILNAIKSIQDPEKRRDAYYEAEDWMFEDAPLALNEQEFGYGQTERFLRSHINEFKTDYEAITNLAYMIQNNEQQDIDTGRRKSFSTAIIDLYKQFEGYNRGEYLFFGQMSDRFTVMTVHNSAGSLENRKLFNHYVIDSTLKSIKAIPAYIERVEQLKNKGEKGVLAAFRKMYANDLKSGKLTEIQLKEMAKNYIEGKESQVLATMIAQVRSSWNSYYKAKYLEANPWRFFRPIELQQKKDFIARTSAWYANAEKILANPANASRFKNSGAAQKFAQAKGLFDARSKAAPNKGGFRNAQEKEFEFNKMITVLYYQLHNPPALVHDESSIKSLSQLVAWNKSDSAKKTWQYDTLDK